MSLVPMDVLIRSTAALRGVPAQTRANGRTDQVGGPVRKLREAPQGPCDAAPPPPHRLTDRVKNFLARTHPRLKRHALNLNKL